MFHPEGEIQLGVAPLAGIEAVVALGDYPFPKVHTERGIALVEDVPQLE